MDYRRLIRNWHEKASESEYFSKFVFEYLAFIAHLKTQKYPSSDPARSVTDRNAIQKLKRDEVKTSYLKAVSDIDELRSAWQKIQRELDGSPLGNVSRNPDYAEEIKWWNCSHDDLTQKTPQEVAKSSGVLHSLDDWENMVEFWHAIRNNLFHGGKDPEMERDQLAVRCGYLTLRELMVILLNEEGSFRI